MVSKMNWKSWVILGAAVALFVASGGLLMASNMGFKLNTPLTPNFKAPGPQGRQWRALPWNSPYTNMTAVCNALVAAGGAAGNLQLTVLDAATGINTNRLCNLVSPNPAIDGRIGLQIRVIAPLSGPPNLPANLVIVGSSNESLLLPVMKGNFKAPGPQFLNWFAPPYHTTWSTAADVCTFYGLAVAGQFVSRLDGSTGIFTNHPCNIPASANFSLVTGEAILLRMASPSPDKAAVAPPHF